MGNKEQKPSEQTPLLIEESSFCSSSTAKSVKNNISSSSLLSYNLHYQFIDSHHQTAPITSNAFLHHRRSLLQNAYDLSKKIFRILPSVAVISLIWFGATPSTELTVTAIRTLAVFIGCILALLTTSIDISILVFTALTVLALTQSFQCQTASGNSVECRLCHSTAAIEDVCIEEAFDVSLKGFASPVVWLIFAAFHLGKAVEVTLLGKRISLHLIRFFGKKGVMGLAYAILLSELILAPFVPSNTARGGGIILPIVQSMAQALLHTSSSPSAEDSDFEYLNGATSTSLISRQKGQQHQKIGQFLMLVGSHANLLSASMYLTGMAPNPIVIAKANALYPDLNFNFITWLTGSSVPALCCAVVLPWLLAWVSGVKSFSFKRQKKKENRENEGYNGHTRNRSKAKKKTDNDMEDDSDLEGEPAGLETVVIEDVDDHEMKGKGKLNHDRVYLRSSFTTEEQQQQNKESEHIGKDMDIVQHAIQQLKDMGALSVKEKQLCFILLLCLSLWVTSAYTHLNSTLVAFIGLAILLHMQTIHWKDIAGHTPAWETLFWLGGFVTMADQLSETGASSYLGHQISLGISNLNLSPVPALAIAYFLTTFLFSSLSAHTVAFAATFLDAGQALNVTHPKILTGLLAYFGALGGCMTNFSTGSVAMYFATGYTSRPKWFLIGGMLAIVYLFVYFTIGIVWWSVLGWTAVTATAATSPIITQH
ncbi:Sodium:sulfate symporter transmembrane region-domain-containing protein [Mycotypha africana]|uniref:Sodium:sulfate symporter transmembrane region-domain-containing protein n=1 Tax=Mycotypha africana TaxID=64632 RepID=UPI0023013360|nr:Sodium:sulfate symporter transmembrane region-domain-containing protein [Mycotypha africana]KAI8968256.1 Sodium:sulfate symporter transmembrane region-domain-containing protein [Mycotypha africana]